LTSLRRTRSGPFVEADCVTLEQLEAMDEDQRHALLRPVDSLLQGHQPITLAPHDSGRFLSGLRRRGAWPDCEHVSVYGQDPHSLLGTAHVKAGELIPTRLLSPLEIKSLLENPA
jgi:tRNA pseudouridine55 synthase